MIATSTTATIPFVAPWREDDPEAPRFLLRAGSIIERGQMEAELAGEHRAGRVHGHELRAAIRAGVETLLSDDPGLDHLLELIDAEADAGGDMADMPEDDQRLLVEVRKLLAEHWPEYRDLVAQLERRREIAPIVALRRFCVGIEGPGVAFARGRDGLVTEATLTSVNPLEMTMAGSRAYNLQYATGEERNFTPPSPSADSRPASRRARSAAGGSLAKKSGRKTRA